MMRYKQGIYMEKPQGRKKKNNKGTWIYTIFLIAAGILCGIMIAAYTDGFIKDDSGGFLSLLFSLLYIYIVYFIIVFMVYFIQTIIHEAGHLVFGLLSGYKFSSFRIANFMWIKEGGRIRFRIFSLAGTSGQCLLIPPDMVSGRFPVMIYNLGGCFMNLIVSLIFGIIFILSKGHNMLSLFSALMLIVGMSVALMNGIPLKLGLVNNDGYNALEVRKNKEAMRALWIQLKVNEQLSSGIRTKDMPQEWFECPDKEKMNNCLVATIAVFAQSRMMDEHKFEDAAKLTDILLEEDTEIIDLHRNMLKCEKIYLELIGEKNEELINRLYDKNIKLFMSRMKNSPSIIRIEYAYALIFEKDRQKAEKLSLAFDKIAKSYPYSAEIAGERELMQAAETASFMDLTYSKT